MTLISTCRRLAACFGFLVLASVALPVHAQEQAIRKAIAEKFPNAKIESLSKTPFPGLLELVVDGTLFYTDEKFTYVLDGSVIDTKSWTNVSQQRREDLEAKQQGPIAFKELPLDQAVKIVKGNGRRVIATFEDPNCGYCKQFHSQLTKLNDVTIYTFLYPIISPPDSVEKSRAVWCSKDRARAWDEVMTSGKIAPAAANCKAPIDEVLKLGQKYNVKSTPTIFLSDGQRLRGALPVEQLDQAITAASKARK
ncbi:MAG: DsbC family protein [Proteobacteria bacterium]|nr:DsbC family protein [Burkholderiales bacterium]